MRSAVTGYSPHYLMFGRCPCLPVDFYFPMKGAHMCSHHIPASLPHLQTNSEVEWQKRYNDKATSTVQLMPGDVVLMKLDAFQGKRKAKDRWSKVEYVVTHQVTSDVPTYKVKDDGRNIKVTHCNRLFLVAL